MFVASVSASGLKSARGIDLGSNVSVNSDLGASQRRKAPRCDLVLMENTLEHTFGFGCLWKRDIYGVRVYLHWHGG